MTDAEVKEVQLQVYLLKSGVDEPAAAIRESADGATYRLPIPLDGVLIAKRSHPSTPKWAAFLEEGVGQSLSELETSSASAVLVLAAGGRFFALTYGYGKSFLDPAKIERSFGLRVALNCIDPGQLRSVDSRTVEELTFHTRRQASRTSEVSSFGLDTARDLLRGVTGTPRDESLGPRVSGSDSLTLSLRVRLADVPAICERLLGLYSSDAYKERFAWIDNLRLVTDPTRVTVLEAAVGEKLAGFDTQGMHMAPPEPVDWQDISGFYYWDPDRAPRHSDLDVDEAIAELATHATGPLTADYLRAHHLWVEFRGHTPVAKFTLHSALVCELEFDGSLYVLSDSDWHEVDLRWAESVRSAVAKIPTAQIALPSAHPGEVEKDYNARAAGEIGAVLMDRCIVRYGPGRDQVEFCDLLTDSRQLVHVKRKTQSATLSHLFFQGQNAASLFAQDAGFRDDVISAAQTAQVDLRGLVPTGSVSPADYEVVFAVVAKPNPRWPRSLPFFSQLSLVSASRVLRGMGYGVSLGLVPLEQ